MTEKKKISLGKNNNFAKRNKRKGGTSMYDNGAESRGIQKVTAQEAGTSLTSRAESIPPIKTTDQMSIINLTPVAEAYLRGCEYEKASVDGKRDWAEHIAVARDVSVIMVRNDACFARQVNTIVANSSSRSLDYFLSHECQLSRQRIAYIAGRTADQQRKIMDQLQAGVVHGEACAYAMNPAWKTNGTKEV